MPPSLAVPYLLYDDAQAALDWVVEALGCTITDTQLDKSGALFHADVRLGEARIMLGAPGPDDRYGGPGTSRIHAMVLVYVPDVDALFARVTTHGATVLAELTDTPWGDRTFGIADPQGQCWYFHQRPTS